MSKTNILQWFSGNSTALTTERILLYLFSALIIAVIIYITYRVTYTGVSYNNKFAVTNIIILLIATVLMMMISSNIAISLGMVGALSIVRYRTAIKDPNDTLFLFWSIVEGLCVGAQMMKMAAVSTLFIAVIVIAATYLGVSNHKYLIIIRGSENLSLNQITLFITNHYPKHHIRTSNYTESGSEIIVEVTSKKTIDEATLKELRGIPGVKSINWLLQTGEYIG